MSPEELVERPALIAQWARDMRDGGDLAGALAASRVASSLAFGDELADFRAAEVVFQADTMIAAGCAEAARELLVSSISSSGGSEPHLYDLHLKLAQLELGEGRHAEAAHHIDLAGRFARTPRQLVALVTYGAAVKPATGASSVLADPPHLPDVEISSRSPLYVVRLFGGLEVSVAGAVVDLERWRKNKARALFLSVVLEQGRDVSRDAILERLWPQLDAASATNNYYVTWNGVKRVLGCANVGDSSGPLPMPIANSGQRCSLRREICRTDLDVFDDALAASREARLRGDGRQALSAFGDLVAVYRGDLLPGDTSCDWIEPYREYYRSQFVDAMGAAARTAIDVGSPSEALSFVTRGLAVDRFAEALYELAIEASIVGGRRDEGIRAYLRCRSLFAEEYGLDPSRRMQALYTRLLEMETPR